MATPGVSAAGQLPDRGGSAPAVGPPDAHRPRWVDLDGVHNLRDLGGLRAGRHRVRDGVLLRSEHLEDLTAEAARRLCQRFGLRSVVDLRDPREDPRAPEWISTHGVTRLHLPLVDLTQVRGRWQLEQDIEQVYRAMLHAAGPVLVNLLRFLVGPGRTPAVVHCAAGKDRTGIAVAVLLAAAGVDRGDIVADYLATEERLAQVRARLLQRPAYRSRGSSSFQRLSAAPILAVLSVLDDHPGGVEGFLTAQGATADELDRWRTILLQRGEHEARFG